MYYFLCIYLIHVNFKNINLDMYLKRETKKEKIWPAIKYIYYIYLFTFLCFFLFVPCVNKTLNSYLCSRLACLHTFLCSANYSENPFEMSQMFV